MRLTDKDMDALRLAIADPGATTPRFPNEHVTDWTARAVLAALAPAPMAAFAKCGCGLCSYIPEHADEVKRAGL